MHLHFLLIVALFAVGLGGPSAAAETAYPARQIRFVVPYSAGGETDAFSRNLANSVPRHLPGAQIDVVNRPGESGLLASVDVLHAPADGYTLLLARVSTHAIRPAVTPATPYRWTDFTVIALLEVDPLICAVKAGSPFKNVRELLAAIRKQPGKYKYATTGESTILNISAQYLLTLAGLKAGAATGVVLTTSPAIIQAVQDGRADFVCNNAASLLASIQSGAMRGLFSTAPGRLAQLPGLPNAREVGLRDMSRLSGWTALMGPRGLPPQVTQAWADALQKVALDPDWLAGNARLAALPVMRPQRQAEHFIQEQVQLYERLVGTMVKNP